MGWKENQRRGLEVVKFGMRKNIRDEEWEVNAVVAE